MKVKKKQSYISLLDWMVEKYHLKGNELIAYALIYGFSQDGESEYKGSYAYLCKWLGVDRATAIRILKRLESKGLLTKRQTLANGKVANQWIAETPEVLESAPTEPENPPKFTTVQHPPDPLQNATRGKTPPVAKCDSDPWQNATPIGGKTPPKYPKGNTIGKSINLSAAQTGMDGQMETAPDRDAVEADFREKLELDTLAHRYDPDKLAELLDNIVEMYCSTEMIQIIGQTLYPTQSIRKMLNKLTSQHVEYIMQSLANTTRPIKNIQAYLRTTILRATATMEFYYQGQANAAVAAQNQRPAGPTLSMDVTVVSRRLRKGGGST